MSGGGSAASEDAIRAITDTLIEGDPCEEVTDFGYI
jgi:hypothetical protein